MKRIKHYYDWWSLLLYMIRKMIIYEAMGDFKNSEETYCWIKVHLTYKGKRIK